MGGQKLLKKQSGFTVLELVLVLVAVILLVAMAILLNGQQR